MKKFLQLITLALGLMTAGSAAMRAADAPAATLEQRVAAIEAYFQNGDPSKPLQGKDGKVPQGLTTDVQGVPGPGHNGFQMVSAALVLFMTLPGLFLFYGGLVRRKNMLSVVAQCYFLAGLVTILWYLFGYSFVFAGGDVAGAWFGDFKKHAFLANVDSTPNGDYSFWVSHNVYSMYQLMFAIITPGLILGAIAERMKFPAVIAFMTAWMLVVYFPLAHWVWGVTGAMNGLANSNAVIKAIDFAGGTVVHMSSGWSALILCLIVGPRRGYGVQPMQPHSMTLCAVGTGMLWVGWYGFNAGSAAGADVVAANAFTTTTLAAAVASFVWALLEYVLRGKPSVLGFCSGAVAGLVVITPACGFVTPSGAVIIGILAGAIPFAACAYLKPKLGYDDALDTFGVHGVGGTLGALLTGVLARNSANGHLKDNLSKYVTDSVGQPLVVEQLKAIVVTIALAAVATVVIAFAIKAVIGLRPSGETEQQGLDLAEHGEDAYHN
jgi:ammonium transporter, Amt family